PGIAALELAQGHRLRLADGFAFGLDERRLVGHRRDPFFFLRRTFRGGPCACGLACTPLDTVLPPSATTGSGEGGASRGAVRDERFGGATGFGIRRRVIRPWPTVHRFVVTQ